MTGEQSSTTTAVCCIKAHGLVSHASLPSLTLPVARDAANRFGKAIAAVTRKAFIAQPTIDEAYFACGQSNESTYSHALRAVQRVVAELGHDCAACAGIGPNWMCARVAAEHADIGLAADFAHMPHSALEHVAQQLPLHGVPGGGGGCTLERCNHTITDDSLIGLLRQFNRDDIEHYFPLLHFITNKIGGIDGQRMADLPSNQFGGSQLRVVLQAGARAVASADVADIALQPVSASIPKQVHDMLRAPTEELVELVIGTDASQCRWPLQLTIAWKTANPDRPHMTSQDELDFCGFPQRPSYVHMDETSSSRASIQYKVSHFLYTTIRSSHSHVFTPYWQATRASCMGSQRARCNYPCLALPDRKLSF